MISSLVPRRNEFYRSRSTAFVWGAGGPQSVYPFLSPSALTTPLSSATLCKVDWRHLVV